MKRFLLALLALVMLASSALAEEEYIVEMEGMYGPHYAWDLEMKQGYYIYDYSPGIGVLPDVGEVAQEKAIELAAAAVKEKFGLTDEQLAAYDPYTYFLITHIRTWDIVFYEREKEKTGLLVGYGVKLRADTGEMVRAFELPPLEHAVVAPAWTAQDEAQTRLDLYEDYKIRRDLQKRYGMSEEEWPIEAWAELARRSPCRYDYSLPKAGEMTQEEAMKKAQALVIALGFDKAVVEKAPIRYFFYDTGKNRLWMIDMTIENEGLITMELDAQTGLVLSPPSQGNG
jgi:hypothetical protein